MRINEHKKSVIDGSKLEGGQKLFPVPQHINPTHNFDWAIDWDINTLILVRESTLARVLMNSRNNKYLSPKYS